MPRPTLGELAPATQAALAVLHRRFWRLREDLDAAAELGRCEAQATGGDLDASVLAAARRCVRDETTPGCGRGDYANDQRKDIRVNSRAQSWTYDQQTARFALRPPRTRTPGQKRRLLRDGLIVFAVAGGFSRRKLAAIFGLSKSRVVEIAHTFRTRTEPEPEPEPESD